MKEGHKVRSDIPTRYPPPHGCTVGPNFFLYSNKGGWPFNTLSGLWKVQRFCTHANRSSLLAIDLLLVQVKDLSRFPCPLMNKRRNVCRKSPVFVCRNNLHWIRHYITLQVICIPVLLMRRATTGQYGSSQRTRCVRVLLLTCDLTAHACFCLCLLQSGHCLGVPYVKVENHGGFVPLKESTPRGLEGNVWCQSNSSILFGVLLVPPIDILMLLFFLVSGCFFCLFGCFFFTKKEVSLFSKRCALKFVHSLRTWRGCWFGRKRSII